VLDRGCYCIGELLMFLGCLLGAFLCFLGSFGFLVICGASFVSWVFVGGLPLFFGLLGLLFVFWLSFVFVGYLGCFCVYFMYT
jgi:hypothetical protein